MPRRTEAKSNVKKGNTATQQLLAWCQHKTKYYEVSWGRGERGRNVRGEGCLYVSVKALLYPYEPTSPHTVFGRGLLAYKTIPSLHKLYPYKVMGLFNNEGTK